MRTGLHVASIPFLPSATFNCHSNSSIAKRLGQHGGAERSGETDVLDPRGVEQGQHRRGRNVGGQPAEFGQAGRIQRGAVVNRGHGALHAGWLAGMQPGR